MADWESSSQHKTEDRICESIYPVFKLQIKNLHDKQV